MTDDNPTGNEPINMAEATSLLLDRQETEDNPQPNQEAQPQAEVEETEATTDINEPTSEEPYEVEEEDEALEAVEEDVSEELEEATTEDEVNEYEEQEYVTVKINGEEQDVTLDELAAGYSRQSDYTRKTTELANQKKQFEQQQSELTQERTALQQGIEQIQNRLSLELSQEPSKEYWENLKETNPLEFMTQKEEFRDKQEELKRVQQAQNELNQRQLAEQQVQMQKHLAQEQQNLVKALPEWKDEKIAETEKQRIVKYAKNLPEKERFTDVELNNASDSRAILILRKAMLFDELQSKKPLVKKKVRKAPKMTKSGKKLVTKNSLNKNKVDKAFNKLRSTGSMDSAVDYLLQKST